MHFDQYEVGTVELGDELLDAAQRSAVAVAETGIEARDPIAGTVIESRRERDWTNLDVSHARRLAIAQLEYDAVDLAGVLAGDVQQLIIKDVAHEAHAHYEPPMISSGMDTTATTLASSVTMSTHT